MWGGRRAKGRSVEEEVLERKRERGSVGEEALKEEMLRGRGKAKMKTCRRGSARERNAGRRKHQRRKFRRRTCRKKCSEEEVLEKEGLLVHRRSFCSSGKRHVPFHQIQAKSNRLPC